MSKIFLQNENLEETHKEEIDTSNIKCENDMMDFENSIALENGIKNVSLCSFTQFCFFINFFLLQQMATHTGEQHNKTFKICIK